jgi:hypothetical protein
LSEGYTENPWGQSNEARSRGDWRSGAKRAHRTSLITRAKQRPVNCVLESQGCSPSSLFPCESLQANSRAKIGRRVGWWHMRVTGNPDAAGALPRDAFYQALVLRYFLRLLSSFPTFERALRARHHPHARYVFGLLSIAIAIFTSFLFRCTIICSTISLSGCLSASGSLHSPCTFDIHTSLSA